MFVSLVKPFYADLADVAGAMDELIAAYDPSNPYYNDSEEYSVETDKDEVHHFFHWFEQKATFHTQMEAIQAAFLILADKYKADYSRFYITGVSFFDCGTQIEFRIMGHDKPYLESVTMESPRGNDQKAWRLMDVVRVFLNK